jgi:hypothetical protein
LNTKIDKIVSNGFVGMKDIVMSSISADIIYVKRAEIDYLKVNDFNINGQVCVDDICLSKDQFKQFLLQNGGYTYTPPVTSQNTTPIVDLNILTSTTTATTTESTVTDVVSPDEEETTETESVTIDTTMTDSDSASSTEE